MLLLLKDQFAHLAEVPNTSGSLVRTKARSAASLEAEGDPLAFDPAWIRKEFQLPATVTDQEIEGGAEFLLNRSERDLNIITGNYLEWRELCKPYGIHVDGKRIPVYSFDSFSGRYFANTVWLFVDAHYGPALGWARVALERLLQEESMRFPDMKQQIEVEGRNPSISKMSAALALKDNWTSDEKSAVTTVEMNGDWTVHHRLDQFAKGKTASDYRMGVARVTFGLGGMKKLGDDLPATVEQNLGTEYRRRGIESLRALCTLFQRYRPANSES